MAQLAIVDAYNEFMMTAQPFLNISNEEDYQDALSVLEEVLESSSDTVNDPLNPLIDLLSNAIEIYETQDVSLQNFIIEAENIPVDLALLKILMREHHLTGSDLPEIGDKTMVSKILNGKRVLSRVAIEKLSKRFDLRPSMFFGEAR